MWWSNNEQRRNQKERIKNIIKRTKLNEKAWLGDADSLGSGKGSGKDVDCDEVLIPNDSASELENKGFAEVLRSGPKA